MKVTIKIIILIVAIALAIGGVMFYAKTQVAPPMATKAVNQYAKQIDNCCNAMANADLAGMDSIMTDAQSKIRIYATEGKVEDEAANAAIDKLLAIYAPAFLDNAFGKFRQSVWHTDDHSHMLAVVAKLRGIKHIDHSSALKRSTADSLALIVNIIGNYKQACAVSRASGFRGIAAARSTIDRARQLANDPYLSNCTNLMNALNGVRPRIAAAHYNYAAGMVEKLANYRFVTQQYYENSLVPTVERAVNQYDEQAKALYGSKRSTDNLWNRARYYYDEATNYYNY
mgnify:FL=1|jgi:hypothetical protein